MKKAGRVAPVIFLAAVVLSLSLSACSSPVQNTAILWTNLPEFAAYCEAFNGQQSTYRVIIVYKADPAAQLATTTTPPDIVVGRYLRSNRNRNNFSALGGLMGRGRIQPTAFYPGALKAGYWDGNQRLLPVSFNLPAIMFLRNAVPKQKSSFFMTLSELGQLAKPFNRASAGELTNVGFSPTWNGQFLYSYAMLRGANFRDNGAGMPTWDDAEIHSGILSIQSWIKDINGGYSQDSAFRSRYLYEPPYVLLTGGRIEFAYTDAATYFQMQENRRQKFGFRWIAENERVPVLDDMVFAGIPNRAPHSPAADAFFRWFFQEKTQARLLAESQRKQLTTFSIANGLSPMPQINQVVLPRYYPQLLGHIPEPFDLMFPPAAPGNWQQIKNQVVEPWLQRAAVGAEAAGSLGEQVKSWLLQHGQ